MKSRRGLWCNFARSCSNPVSATPFARRCALATAHSWFVGTPEPISTTAFRNDSLQGGYFIIAARALRWDTGSMSGFHNLKLDAEFFPDGKWKSNFIFKLGRGDPAKVFGRDPRLTFEEACRVL